MQRVLHFRLVGRHQQIVNGRVVHHQFAVAVINLSPERHLHDPLDGVGRRLDGVAVVQHLQMEKAQDIGYPYESKKGNNYKTTIIKHLGLKKSCPTNFPAKFVRKC